MEEDALMKSNPWLMLLVLVAVAVLLACPAGADQTCPLSLSAIAAPNAGAFGGAVASYRLSVDPQKWASHLYGDAGWHADFVVGMHTDLLGLGAWVLGKMFDENLSEVPPSATGVGFLWDVRTRRPMLDFTQAMRW
jgi:hypothetical protein